MEQRNPSDKGGTEMQNGFVQLLFFLTKSHNVFEALEDFGYDLYLRYLKGFVLWSAMGSTLNEINF